MKKSVFYILTVFLLLTINPACCQFQSLDFNFSASNYLDGNEDTEFDYEYVNGGLLAVWTVGFSHQIQPKYVVTPIIGFSHALQFYRDFQSGTIMDRTFTEKSMASYYLTSGCGFTYWVFEPGSWLSVKSELYVHYLIHSKTDTRKTFNNNLEEFRSEDTTDKLNKVMPVFKIGPEFSLRLGKRIAINTGFFLDFRASGYFKESINTSYVNKGFQMGFRAILNG